ncbi:MAG: zinc transporter ZupT [Nanoarchaeota archaeon]|nr:zinc transporter ZupT [Nanoarchaeota archaeon]
MIETSTILIAFGLTLFAGLSTGIGSALAFFTKKTNTKFLSLSLGFSAGVMIYVSFMEMMPTAILSLGSLGTVKASWIAVISFFLGILVAALIDKALPKFENPHEIHRIEELGDKKEAKKCKKLYRMGIFAAIAIAVHNFPEGIVTFASAITNLKLGVMIAIAIALHNIPEGIAVSVSIYYATGNRKKAFFYSFLSGLAEPLGALIGLLLVMTIFKGFMIGILFAAVAGIMIFISLDELLPAAQKYGEHHLSIYGLVAGMAVMAVSMLMFL